MPLTKQEIIDYALRYIEHDDVVDFPEEGDVFFFMERELTLNSPDNVEKHWQFGGYGICSSYELDQESKPLGKWIWVYYLSLLSFPPQKLTLKLQPPHIAKGYFQNPERTMEIKIVKVESEEKVEQQSSISDESEPSEPKRQPEGKIIQFPKRPE